MGCSEVGTDSDGDVHAKSWDTDGNTYHVDTDTCPYRNGHEIESMILARDLAPYRWVYLPVQGC